MKSTKKTRSSFNPNSYIKISNKDSLATKFFNPFLKQLKHLISHILYAGSEALFRIEKTK